MQTQHMWARLLLGLIVLSVAGCTAATEHTIEPYQSNAVKGFVLTQRAAAQCLLFGQNDRVQPIRSFTTDGCSMFPDTESNQPCCIEHDIAYWCGGSAEARRKADAEFGRCVSENSNDLMGFVMEKGVRIGGHPFFPTPYRWGYGHAYRPIYPSAVADD
jgi:hypothetical protein